MVIINKVSYGFILEQTCLFETRKFYIRRKKSKVVSIETGCTAIAYLFPWSGQEKIAGRPLF